MNNNNILRNAVLKLEGAIYILKASSWAISCQFFAPVFLLSYIFLILEISFFV
jgi:hypothetical protein